MAGFQIRGHAGFDARGRDVVCAGVSAVTQTALLGLMELLEDVPEFQRKPGFLTCRLSSRMGTEDRIKAEAILEAMRIGLVSLAEDYPRNLEIKEQEVS